MHARTMPDYKVVSMNLMHHDLQITGSIYAPMFGNDVQKRIANLASQPVSQPDDDLRALVSWLRSAVHAGPKWGVSLFSKPITA